MGLNAGFFGKESASIAELVGFEFILLIVQVKLHTGRRIRLLENRYGDQREAFEKFLASLSILKEKF